VSNLPKKKKKKLGKHNPQKNKPAQKKNKGVKTEKFHSTNIFSFHQPKRIDIQIFMSGGRGSKPKIQAGHKGSLRRG